MNLVRVSTCAMLVLLCGFTIQMTAAAPSPQQTPPKRLTPDEVIRQFADKESQFYDAWMQYAYRQITDIRVVSVDGTPSRERMSMESEIVFNDDGSREVRLVRKVGRLQSVGFTAEDEEVINNLQPFSLTTKELPLYDLKYEGKEQVDELNCYVFSVKPKTTKGNRMYFSGKIWVDDTDLQIVRTVGKPVPEKEDQRFPEFETLRQVVDKKYWFPVWTHGDSVLDFQSDRVRVEETITYGAYKRFATSATIKFDPVKK